MQTKNGPGLGKISAPLRSAVLSLCAAGMLSGCAEGTEGGPGGFGEIGSWGTADVSGNEDALSVDLSLPDRDDESAFSDSAPDEPRYVPPSCVETALAQPVWTFFSKSCDGSPSSACCGVDLGEVIAAHVGQRFGAVDACVMELQDFTVSDALIDAKLSGRTVRVVVDDSYADPQEEKAIADLHAAGIVPVSDPPYPEATMHSKFVVLDGHITLISSGNFSTFDAGSNANNLVAIDSVELAGLFTEKFETFWEDGKFHEDAKAGPHFFDLPGGKVEVIFGPSQELVERLVTAIEQAQEAIHFSIYAFTLDEVKAAILSRCGEVEILGVYDSDQDRQGQSEAAGGWCPQADVRSSNVQGEFGFKKLHHKVLIVDPHASGLVVTGSANWSYSAAEKNDEVMVVVRFPSVVAAFEAEFRARHAEASAP